MHILIVEDALKEKSGHWYEYCREVSTELRLRGHCVTMLINKNADIDIVQELGANPYFPYSAWLDGVGGRGRIRSLYAVIAENLVYYRHLRDAFREIPKTDLVLAPSLTISYFIAWLLLCHTSRGRWFKKAFLMVRTNAGVYCPESQGYTFPGMARISGFVLRRFKRFTRSGLVEFASDSRRLSEQYGKLSKQTFSVMPHPRLVKRTPDVGSENLPITFASLGQPRHEKGSDLVIKAFSLLLSQLPLVNFRLVFQSNFTVLDSNGIPVVVPASWRTDPRVKLIERSISSEEYEEHLFKSDIVLLPYRRSQYFSRLSGIAIETFQAGKRCVCVSNTWVEDCMLEFGSGVSIVNESVDDLYRALMTILNERIPGPDSFRISAVRDYHSPAKFADHLLESFCSRHLDK